MSIISNALKQGFTEADLTAIQKQIDDGVDLNTIKNNYHSIEPETMVDETLDPSQALKQDEPIEMLDPEIPSTPLTTETPSPIKRYTYDELEERLVPGQGKGSAIDNVETLSRTYLDSNLAKSYSSLNRFRNTILGTDSKFLERMNRVKYDGVNDPEAQKVIDNLRDIESTVYDSYVKTGGKQIKANTMIQTDTEKMLSKSEADFIAHVSPLVRQSDEYLSKAYRDAQDGGYLDDLDLDFQDSKASLLYAQNYGRDMWSSTINRIKKLSTETAFNRAFGVTSPAELKKIISNADLSTTQRRTIENMVNSLNGTLNIADPKNKASVKWAKAGRMARSAASASQLGSAVIMTIGDFGTMLATAGFNSMPRLRSFVRQLAGYAKAKSNEELLARLGFISDEFIDGMMNGLRFDPNSAGADIASQAADKVLRASGMMFITNSNKNTWKLSHLANLAEQSSKSKRIPKGMKKQLELYGINQKDWDNLRAQKGEFTDITKLPPETAHKIRKMVTEESNYAVMGTGARIQATMTQGFESGTVMGEGIRFVGQYKSFYLAAYNTHIMRALKLDTPLEQAEYSLSLVMYGVATGMAITAIKDAKDGQDPFSRDYTDPKNAVKALEVSGILGPLGEFLKDNKHGESAFDIVSLAGSPVIGTITKFLKTAGSGMMSDKQFETVMGDLGKQAGNMLPGSNLLYTQWATDYVGRKLMILANPKYERKFDQYDRRKAKRLKKDGLEEIQSINLF